MAVYRSLALSCRHALHMLSIGCNQFYESSRLKVGYENAFHRVGWSSKALLRLCRFRLACKRLIRQPCMKQYVTLKINTSASVTEIPEDYPLSPLFFNYSYTGQTAKAFHMA